MELLNLGCGGRFHKDWKNIDFYGDGEKVIAHNLLEGIPFSNSTFDIVYHSHLLEHFTKEQANKFLSECNRVLKHRGIIRIVVPDLEMIAKEYLVHLEKADKGNTEAQKNYNWIILEFLDQLVRDKSGGEMAEYFKHQIHLNEKYVIGRIGEEAISIKESFIDSPKELPETGTLNLKKGLNFNLNILIYKLKQKIKNSFFKDEIIKYKNSFAKAELGNFRSSGEVHKWMYDRYSLKTLLKNTGFTEIQQFSANESNIPNWNIYKLDWKNGKAIKPDSIYFEARKPKNG